jgi:dihydroorotase
MMKVQVPTVKKNGVNNVYVTSNFMPLLTSASDVLAYKHGLQQEDPMIDFVPTLYLHENISPAVVKSAKAQKVVGIRSYPASVTTNSSSGVLDYELFYPVFQAMKQCGMVLNLHGEHPSDHAKNITILNSEFCFLPPLKSLHAKFTKCSSSTAFSSSKNQQDAVFNSDSSKWS